MTPVAHPLSSPRAFPAAPSTSATANGFAALDERVAAGTPGVVLVRASSPEAVEAIGAHVARRARATGFNAIEARATRASPLFREVASRVGLTVLPNDPAEAADAIARAAGQRHAVIVAALPPPGGWDRAVASAISTLSPSIAVVLLATGAELAEDLRADDYDVGTALDAGELARWWAALAESAQGDVSGDEVATLEAWWANARQVPMVRAAADGVLTPSAEHLARLLALASRGWPVADVAFLGAEEGAAEALARTGAARLDGGWIALEPSWDARARSLADAAGDGPIRSVARALTTRFDHDAWAQSRAAELLVRVDAWSDADQAHARAMTLAQDSLVRRELVSRWMTALSTLPADAQLLLRVRATERALAIGEAEEGFRWAQSATALAPHDAQISLLFGRAAVVAGDLVAAKVALERSLEFAEDAASRGVISAELAEVAYLASDLKTAEREAARALSLAGADSTRLKARNVLGKLLLAASSWDEADVHFAEDALSAAAASLRMEERRARLNRGIALLSKGLVDEARAVFEAVLGEGERAGDARACAFALDNLSVVATLRHEYAQALSLSERTLRLRQRLGDRVASARLLGNLAELRRRLGLIDHAEHAVAFGRRTLGPGMPPAGSAQFSRRAARNALMRGNTVEARREVMRALAESEAAGMKDWVCEAYCVATRVALDDGDLPRAAETLERARSLASTDELRAESAIVAARLARASGEPCDALATEALSAARVSGVEDLVIEAHFLLAEIHRAAERVESARAHVDSAVTLRDQVAANLPNDVRAAYLSRPDLLALARLHAALAESTSAIDAPPSSPMSRTSARASSLPREIVGDDPAVRGLMAAIRKVARSSSTVLVRGESGTGKELVAEAIHHASERASGPLVTVNCAALVETLLLSELFGHEKGAFTGAIARRRGRFELAEGGTLFLDEIGDISGRTQVALLRVLQERTFERVGGTTPIRANVRVICATHRDLRSMVERGEFREDLYYRLRGITLEVPALRARMGDLPRISDHLLDRIALERGEPRKELSPDALELLGRHRWPGNVRELENALRAASLFADGNLITAGTLAENVDDLRSTVLNASRRVLGPASLAGLAGQVSSTSPSHDEASSEALPGPGDEDAEIASGPLPNGEASATAVAYSQVRGGTTSLPDIKRQIERDCIARALAETKGNITRAATLLGMKRPRLSQLVKQYGLAAVSSEGS
ncbi:MAG TPA: sigma 54-interacting transcriptional regulator [Polyangiaceae bacterium]|jgi:transcriptional regulator with GAF, ATPase, and Fis domain